MSSDGIRGGLAASVAYTTPGEGGTPQNGSFYLENRPQNNYHDRLTTKMSANVPPHTPPCAMTQHGGLFATAAIAVA
jgi:hypothetical protein